MVKLSMQHINAICHAELLMDTCSLNQGAAKLRMKLEDDLLRLAELKLFIIQQFRDPQRTFELEDKPNGNNHPPG